VRRVVTERLQELIRQQRLTARVRPAIARHVDRALLTDGPFTITVADERIGRPAQGELLEVGQKILPESKRASRRRTGAAIVIRVPMLGALYTIAVAALYLTGKRSCRLRRLHGLRGYQVLVDEELFRFGFG